MLRQVIAVEAGLVGVLQQLQALLVQVGQLQPWIINPIENSEPQLLISLKRYYAYDFLLISICLGKRGPELTVAALFVP